jgi:hypothetical protein
LIQWALEEFDRPTKAEQWLDPHDVPATVQKYLERAYADEPDRRARLLAAFTSLYQLEEEVI